MSAWHEQTIEQIKESLSVDLEKGLTSSELSEREAKFGKNKLKEGKKHGLLYKFFMQMKDMMIIVLLVAAAVSAEKVALPRIFQCAGPAALALCKAYGPAAAAGCPGSAEGTGPEGKIQPAHHFRRGIGGL